MNFTEC